MGLFDKMKQAVGIGGAKVEVRLNPGPVALGGFAKGRVLLKGGKGEQKCDGIVLELKRITTLKVEREGKLVDQDSIDVIATEKLADYSWAIHPESEQSWDFAVKVPREGGPGSRIKYQLYATADIPGAIDPSNTVDLPVTDAPQLTQADVPELLSTVRTLRSQGGDNGPQIEGLLKQVLGFEPMNTEAMRLLAEQIGYRNEAEAVPYWNKYLQVVPTDVEAWEELARNAERRSAYAEALQVFDKALTMAPKSSSLHGQRARVLVSMSRLDDAIAAYDNALTGDRPEGYYGIERAKTLAKANRKAEAEAALVAVAQSGDPWVLEQVLEALFDLGSTQHEEAIIAHAFKVNQDDPYRVHQVNADRLLKRQQYEKAIEAIDQAMKGTNHSEWTLSKLMGQRGQALEHLRRTDEAKLAYKKALEIDANNYDAKTRLKAL